MTTSSNLKLKKTLDIGRCKFSSKHMTRVVNTPLINYVNKGGSLPHPMFRQSVHITTQTKASGRPLGTRSRPKSRIEYSLTQRTDALLRGLSLILEHHDARERVLDELKDQVHKYLDSSNDEEVWLSRCKYLLCYPLAKYLRNLLPKAPDMSFKPSGLLRGWMKARLNAFNVKNTHLWYSWFQAKRATLPLSEGIVRQTYDKHFATLTKPDPLITGEPLLEEFQRDYSYGYSNRTRPERVMTEGDKYVDQIFKDPVFRKVLDKIRHSVTKNYYYSKNLSDICPDSDFPKTSACFEGTRNNGGQAQVIREHLEIDCSLPREGELYSMEFCPKIIATNKISSSTYKKTCPQGAEEWSLLQNLARECSKEETPLKCTIQAVLEPNKIRVISKGEALPYYTCKGLQKIIHSAVKKIPAFRLIGRPLCPTDILDLLKKAESDWKWCSIDYSAATDGLSYQYSSRILDSIICNLDEDLQRVAKRVLGPHDLYYPSADKKGEPEFRGRQTNGQLMGSILSFPILCLANFGVYLRATRSIRDGWSYEDTVNHVLINGDDMLYAAPPRINKKNIDIGRAVGLEMSVGKAYLHHAYMNINSQSLLCDLSSVQRQIKPVNFLNVGLFFGQHKVQGRKDDGKDKAKAHTSDAEGIVANINTLLEGSLPGKEISVLKKCLEINRDTINKECCAKTFRNTKVQRNLFISEKLGGMGVRPPMGWKFKVTKSDLAVAHGMLNRFPLLGKSRCLPLEGFETETLEESKNVPWEPRVTGDEFNDRRLPFNNITFWKLKMYCRSPHFSFYSDSRTALVQNYSPEVQNKKTFCPDFDNTELFELFEASLTDHCVRTRREEKPHVQLYKYNEQNVKMENAAGSLLHDNYERKLLPSEIPDRITISSLFDEDQECDATDILVRQLYEEFGAAYHPSLYQ